MSVKITIPAPCSENWEQMSVVPGGRHCTACQHKVTDFSGMSDEELLAVLRRNAGLNCGRFLEGQLDRCIAEPVRQRHLLNRISRRFAAAAVIIAGVAAPSIAQRSSGSSQKQGTPRQNPVKLKSVFLPEPVAEIRGTVIDERTGEQLISIGVTLLRDSAQIAAVVTDIDGRFVLRPDSGIKVGQELVLQIAGLGYKGGMRVIAQPGLGTLRLLACEDRQLENLDLHTPRYSTGVIVQQRLIVHQPPKRHGFFDRLFRRK